MRHNQPIILIAITLLFTITLGSCKSTRNLATTTTGQQSDITTAGELETLVSSYKDWTDVNMTVKCKMRSPKSLSVSGKATMVRGSEIQISLRMLGFEVAGLYIDKDSLYVYEKLNRSMIAEPLSKITNASGLTITDIQDLLLGRLCYPGDGTATMRTLSKFDIAETDGKTILTPNNSSAPWAYTLGGSPLEMLSVIVDLGSKGQAICQYTSPLSSAAGPVSPSATLTANAGKIKLDATFEWSLGSAQWNQGTKPSAAIPKGYTRLKLEQLIKALSLF